MGSGTKQETSAVGDCAGDGAAGFVFGGVCGELFLVPEVDEGDECAAVGDDLLGVY